MSVITRRLFMSSMMLRQHHRRLTKRLHPSQIRNYVNATQAPKPLAYPLHPAPQQQPVPQPHPAPLGTLTPLPFGLTRTTSGNLPVYITYNCNHVVKRTVIRRLTGDVDKFAEELKKVVSNAEVRKKVGKVEVPGVHRESVEAWLLRLGL